MSGSTAFLHPPPERLVALRAGEADTRGISVKNTLADVGDTIASITSIAVARRDGATIGSGDLAIPPAGYAGPALDGSGLVVTWWQGASAAIVASGDVDYHILVTLRTVGGRAICIDLYQLVSATVG